MRSRGRPREFDRNDALDKAVDYFWTTGFENAQIVELIAAMGIRAPSFYSAFASKEQIFREVADRYKAEIGAVTMEKLNEGTTAFEGLRAMLTRTLDVVLSPRSNGGCMLMLGMVNARSEDKELSDYLKSIRAETTWQIEERLLRGQREGDVPPGVDAKALAAYFGVILQGLSLRARDGASREELAQTVDLALGTLPRPSPRPRRS